MRKCLVYILQHVRTIKTKNGLCMKMKISWKGQNQKDKKKHKNDCNKTGKKRKKYKKKDRKKHKKHVRI